MMKRDTKNKNLFQFIKLCYGSIQGRMSFTIVLRRKEMNYQVECNKKVKKLSITIEIVSKFGPLIIAVMFVNLFCGWGNINDSNIPHSDEASITP